MKLTKKFFCPVNGWDCPYWKEDGSCELLDLGDNPLVECDDASFYIDESDELIDCVVWEDENGNRYDIQELLQRGYHIVNGEPEKAPSPPCMRTSVCPYKAETADECDNYCLHGWENG